jgi:CRP/FNR family nitrogen fixation transcriptional regulator
MIPRIATALMGGSEMLSTGQLIRTARVSHELSPAARGVAFRARAVTPPTNFAVLDQIGTLCRFTKNEMLFAQGDEAETAYKILGGAVRLLRITGDGRRQIIGFRLPGDVLGLDCEGVCTMTAEAVGSVTAVRCSRARIDRSIAERPQLREDLSRLLWQEVKDLQRHLVVLGCQTAMERVASFLARLAQRAGARDGAAVDLHVSRKDIADYLGLTLETVSRTLSELRRRGVIDFPKSRQVLIKSIGRLRELTADAS